MNEEKREYLIPITEEVLQKKAERAYKLRQMQAMSNTPSLCDIDVTNLEVITGNQYFELSEGIPEEELEDYIENNWEEYCLISEIIALEVSLYCIRRVSRAGGENSDAIRRIIQEKIAEYEKTFNKSFKDPNERCRF